MYTWRRQFARQ